MRTRPAALELDHKLEYRICSLVREGIPLVDASRALGLGPRTVYRWLYWGRRADHAAIYTSFAASIRAAEAERRYYVGRLIDAAISDTRPASRAVDVAS